MATSSKNRKNAGAPAGLLLTPGASADRNQPSLVAIEDGLDLPVERWDFPYKREGRKAPDRAPKLMASATEGLEGFAERLGVGTDAVLVGGRSMGGRICSMVAAEMPVAGVVAISYPLHPPGKPEKVVERTAHFPSLDVPCLFVSGTKDSFGKPAELEAATEAIPGEVTHVWVDGGDHGLRRKDDQVVDAIATWLADRWA